MNKDLEGMEMDMNLVHFMDQPTFYWDIENNKPSAIGANMEGMKFVDTKSHKIDRNRNLQEFFNRNKGNDIVFYMNGESIYHQNIGIQTIRVYINNK